MAHNPPNTVEPVLFYELVEQGVASCIKTGEVRRVVRDPRGRDSQAWLDGQWTSRRETYVVRLESKLDRARTAFETNRSFEGNLDSKRKYDILQACGAWYSTNEINGKLEMGSTLVQTGIVIQ